MKRKNIPFLVLIALFGAFNVRGDTPPPRGVNSQTYDSSGNGIGSTVDSGTRGLNVHITNPAAPLSGFSTEATLSTINSKITTDANGIKTSLSYSPVTPLSVESIFGGTAVDPRARSWTLLNSTDSIDSHQGGTWSVGRTWTLSSATDSVAVAFPPTLAVTQSTTPWVVSGSINAIQSGLWFVDRFWNLNYIDDSVAVHGITGEVSLPTGASTMEKQDVGNNSLNSIDDKLRSYDGNSGAGSEFLQGVMLRASESGGSVEAGTSVRPLRMDPTGTTTQPVSVVSSALPMGAATAAKQDTGNASLAQIDADLDVLLSTRASVVRQDTGNASLGQIDADLDVFLSTRASESTLSTLNGKITNDFGLSSAAVRTACQMGNPTGLADFNTGAATAQTLRTTIDTGQFDVALSTRASEATLLDFQTDNHADFLVVQGKQDTQIARLDSILAEEATEAKQDTQIARLDSILAEEATEAKQDTQIARLDSLLIENATIANETTLLDFQSDNHVDHLETQDRLGAKTETAPGTDTASSGLNGRLQRIAQNLTTIDGQINSDFGATSGAIRVAAIPGNASGIAAFGAGATNAQTPRAAANLYDALGNAVTTQADGSQRALDVEVNSQPEHVGTRAGQMFHVSTNRQALTGTTEVAFFYFKNPSGSGKNAEIYRIDYSPILDVGDNTTYRLYLDPTVSADGTGLTEIGNRQTGQNAAVVTAFFAPTVSANGTLLKTIIPYGATLESPYNGSLIVEPNHSVLITRQISASGTLGGVNVEWRER